VPRHPRRNSAGSQRAGVFIKERQRDRERQLAGIYHPGGLLRVNKRVEAL